METAKQTALMEQPEILELFRVLEGNGLEKEQKEVESLVKYLDGMEIQFGQVLEELRDVKEQLSQIQDSGVKASVLRITEQAGGKVQEAEDPYGKEKSDTVRKECCADIPGKRKRRSAQSGIIYENPFGSCPDTGRASRGSGVHEPAGR